MKKEIYKKRLLIKSFHITKVIFGNKSDIKDRELIINKEILDELIKNYEIIEKINIQIIEPRKYNIWVNNIMDVIPISTKVLGNIGEGITHTITGVYVLLTGAYSDGKQITEFGSSEGILKDHIVFGKAGTPSLSDYIINFDVILKPNLKFNRESPLTIHKVCDEFIQIYRNILKKFDGRKADEVNEYFDIVRPGKKKVVIIKQIGGQGAMHDNQLLPKEPSGFIGGKSIIDIGNVPIILTPNEYRDGALRAMT
ncbi:proline reductase [Caloranaerobacter sp. TR13]|uniref:proline reductase cluster protein PrdD n=1 Tax=Caloranaerobacter sp. TR13 TaxID=1302151 RepID=UPI0006D3F244|nr:proline reductase cluster protein PrdD [Caloranaerobacter sp. TR13]KPU27038.1 proline reductase [Caloranaerobacter sp. TR13]